MPLCSECQAYAIDAIFYSRNSSEIFLAAEIRRGIHPVDSYSQNV